MDERLKVAITLVADALEHEYGVCELNICGDLSYVASQMLRDAGFDAVIVGAKSEAFGFRADLGHAWIRVDGWNVDFSLGQFPEARGLPYPFVTWKDDPAALEIYGPGSSDPKEPLYQTYRGKLIFYVSLESLIAERTLRDFQTLRWLERAMDILPYYRAVQRFRRAAKREGLMDKPIPALKLPKNLPRLKSRPRWL